MTQIIQISQTKFDELLNRITRLESMVTKLLEKSEEPPHDTDEWWEWSDKKALKDIQSGDFVEFNSAKDMVEHLKNL